MAFWGTVGRIGAGIATGGLSEAKKYLYDDPAEEQKRGADAAAGASRSLGDRMGGYYEDARQRSQGYYGKADSYADNTYGPDYVSQLYGSKQGQPGPLQSRSFYGDQQNYYNTHQTHAYNTYDQNRNYYAQDPRLQEYAGSMKEYGNSETASEARNRQVQGQKMPSYLQDRYAARKNDRVDLSQLNSRTDETRAKVGGMTSAAAGLRFDPRATEAYRQLYEGTLLPEGQKKGYLEQFYEDSANGTNPYFDRQKDQLSKAMERRAAASGGFNAGTSMRQQGEALADLEAQEYHERGQLAGQAQGAHQGRLGDLAGQAKTLEDVVMGNRQFNLEAAGQQDQFGLGRAGIEAGLAKSGDENYLRGQELDQQGRRDIDTLASQSSQEGFRGEDLRSSAARDSDSAEATRRRDYVNYLDTLEREGNTRKNDEFNHSLSVDEQDRAARQDLGAAANSASSEEAKHDDYLRGLARDASDETATNQRDRFDRLTKIAAERAGIDWNHVQAAGGAISDAEWNAIEIELKRSGIDAQTIAAMRNDILTGGATAIKAGAGGAPAVAAGGKAGTGSPAPSEKKKV